MHRCLQIEEILNHIIDFTSENDNIYIYPPRPDWKTAAALARTCRAFLDPALNKMWYKLFELEPLFALFPQDSWGLQEKFLSAHDYDSQEEGSEDVLGESDDGFMGKEFHFTRPLLVEDWSRFRSYASRVHSLHYSLDSGRDPVWVLPPATLDELKTQLGDQTLFPELNSFKWLDYRPDMIPQISLFLPRNLSELNIQVYFPTPWTEREMNQLCPLIPVLCPNLASLTLKGIKMNALNIMLSPSPSVQSVPRALASLQTLDASEIKDVPSEVLIALSELPQLKKLSLRFKSLPPFQPRSLPFSTMQDLHLSSNSAETLTNVLNAIQTTHIHSLPIILQQKCSVKTLLGLGQSSAQFPSLTHLSWVVRRGRDAEPFTCSTTLDTISPILSLNNLEKLNLDVPSFRFDDKMLDLIAKAFPSIKELALIPSSGTVWKSHITIHALRSVAEHCPQIRDLKLVFNAAELTAAGSASLVLQPQNFGLERLNVGCSDIRKPKRVASYLSKCFPNLRDIEAWGYIGLKGPTIVLHLAVLRERNWRNVKQRLARKHSKSMRSSSEVPRDETESSADSEGDR